MGMSSKHPRRSHLRLSLRTLFGLILVVEVARLDRLQRPSPTRGGDGDRDDRRLGQVRLAGQERPFRREILVRQADGSQGGVLLLECWLAGALPTEGRIERKT